MYQKAIKRFNGIFLSLMFLAAMAGTAGAVTTFNMTAGPTTLTMPDGVTQGFGNDLGEIQDGQRQQHCDQGFPLLAKHLQGLRTDTGRAGPRRSPGSEGRSQARRCPRSESGAEAGGRAAGRGKEEGGGEAEGSGCEERCEETCSEARGSRSETGCGNAP